MKNLTEKEIKEVVKNLDELKGENLLAFLRAKSVIENMVNSVKIKKVK